MSLVPSSHIINSECVGMYIFTIYSYVHPLPRIKDVMLILLHINVIKGRREKIIGTITLDIGTDSLVELTFFIQLHAIFWYPSCWDNYTTLIQRDSMIERKEMYQYCHDRHERRGRLQARRHTTSLPSEKDQRPQSTTLLATYLGLSSLGDPSDTTSLLIKLESLLLHVK